MGTFYKSSLWAFYCIWKPFSKAIWFLERKKTPSCILMLSYIHRNVQTAWMRDQLWLLSCHYCIVTCNGLQRWLCPHELRSRLQKGASTLWNDVTFGLHISGANGDEQGEEQGDEQGDAFSCCRNW
jgi:hypothetical protein